MNNLNFLTINKILSNEKSFVWISTYKKIVVTSFWLFLIGGVVLGICDITAFIDILYDDTILDLILWPILGAVFAIVELVNGMLIANFLSNVQTIRIKIEEKSN